MGTLHGWESFGDGVAVRLLTFIFVWLVLTWTSSSSLISRQSQKDLEEGKAIV